MQYCNFILAWWFNVGVQIFLCISGYLYGGKEFSEGTLSFYHRRFKKILKPYWITIVIFSAVEFLFFRNYFSVTHFVGALFAYVTITGGEHLWFIPLILMCYIITPLLNECKKNVVEGKRNGIAEVIITVFVVSLFFGLFATYFNPAEISCYTIGYWIGVNRKKHFINKRVIFVIFTILALSLNLIQVYLSYFLKPRFIDSTIYSYWCNYNHVWLGIFLFLLMMSLFDHISWNLSSKKVLVFADSYSYETYLVHSFFVLGPMSLMAVTKCLPVNVLIICGCIIGAAVVIRRLDGISFPQRKQIKKKDGFRI